MNMYAFRLSQYTNLAKDIQNYKAANKIFTALMNCIKDKRLKVVIEHDAAASYEHVYPHTPKDAAAYFDLLAIEVLNDEGGVAEYACIPIPLLSEEGHGWVSHNGIDRIEPRREHSRSLPKWSPERKEIAQRIVERVLNELDPETFEWLAKGA